MYSNLTILKSYLPSSTIEQLTDDDNIGEIQDDIVNEAIANAQVTIDGYCRGRYPADMDDDDVPDLITDITTKLTAYNLYRRRLITTLPETISKDYAFCLTTMRAIQSGKISPWPAADEPVIIKTNKTAASTIYNQAVWDTFV